MDRPALAPAVALLAGAGAGVSHAAAPGPGGVPASAALAVAALAVAAWLVFTRRAARVAAAVTLAGFAAAGLAGGQLSRTGLRAPLLSWFDAGVGNGPSRPSGLSGLSGPSRASGAVTRIEGRLRHDAVPTDYGASLTVDVTRVGRGRRRRPVRGTVRAGVGGSLVPERIGQWRAGRAVRMPVRLRHPARYANTGLPDQAHRLRTRGIHLLGSVKSALLVEVIARGPIRAEWGGRVRAAVRRSVAAAVGRHDARSAAIVTAVLIGDRAGLDRETTDRLQRGGTYHVIAISGGNIAILTAALLLALRVAGLARRPAALLVIFGLLAYAQVVAAEASVTRAVFAAVIFLAALAADHRTDPLNTLALAAGCLVAADPRALLDPGFQLTFGATAGLLLGVPRLMRWGDRAAPLSARGRRIAAAPAGLLLATICAELALFPIGALHFSRVTVAGLALNFAAIPLMTVTQVAGMVAVGLAPLHLPSAAAVGWVAHVAAAGIVDSTRLVDWAPWLEWRLPAPVPLAIGAYYAGWLLCLASARRWRRRAGAALAAVSAAAMLAAPLPAWRGGRTEACPLPGRGPGDGPAPLHVHFLDVDQGDATLVRFPDGRSLLVDAGGRPGGGFDIGSRVVTPALWALGVRSLDYLAITHAHPDHVGGAAAVVAHLGPREIWEGIPVPASQPLADLRAVARDRRAAWRTVRAGDAVSIGGVLVRAAHPAAADWERRRVRNDDSLVLELRYGRVSVILPGDIGAEVEGAVAAALGPAALRVVKAPHHGSRSSSSAAFVEALRPSLAVMSAGRANSFGHPHPEVVDRYEASGAVVLWTGRDGAVTVCTDGRGVAATTVDGRRVTFGGPAD